MVRMSLLRNVLIAILLVVALFFGASFLNKEDVAKTGEPVESTVTTESIVEEIPVEPKIPAERLSGDFKTAIVIDAETGFVLVDSDADVRRQPASMLKMMTELIVLEHVASGDLHMDDIVKVSAKASKMGGSQVYLRHNDSFKLVDLLRALAIHSANDAACALAEHVAGSTLAFTDLMNMRAEELGMTNSDFHSVHGLPTRGVGKPDLTTARDLSILALALLEHPEALEWSSQKTAPFKNGTFETLYNPNKLIGKFRGLDGLKTGFTSPAGFCVTATAVQKGRRLVSVVMGCSSDKARAEETTRLLSYGFNKFIQVPVIPEGGSQLPDPVAVKGGKVESVLVAYGDKLLVSVHRDRKEDLVVHNEFPEKIQAPLAAGEAIGRAVVTLDGVELGSVPLVTMVEVQKGNWFNRLLN
jgi:serine-type D-Ala-D-Ala carboxypeptidase (penicillin-binding protein 5/6)